MLARLLAPLTRARLTGARLTFALLTFALLTFALLTASALGPVGPLTSPAHASDEGEGGGVRFLAPVMPGEQHYGFTGPYSVDLTAAADVPHELTVTCSNIGGVVYQYSAALTPGDVRTVHLPPINHHRVDCTPVVDRLGPGTERLEVARGYLYTTAALTLTRTSATPAVFYPYVKDRYRDTTGLGYQLNRRAKLTYTITNAAGKTVRTHQMRDPYLKGVPFRQWTWNGRTADAVLVPVGVYTVRVTATAADGVTASATYPVEVARGFRDRKSVVSYSASRAKLSATGNCYISRDAGAYSVSAACYGPPGRARAVFTVRVPADAKKVTGTVRVTRRTYPATPACCAKVRKRVRRTSPTTVKVAVTLSGNRAWIIEYARVRYIRSIAI